MSSFPKIVSVEVDLFEDTSTLVLGTDNGWVWTRPVYDGETFRSVVALYPVGAFVDADCEPNPEGEV